MLIEQRIYCQLRLIHLGNDQRSLCRSNHVAGVKIAIEQPTQLARPLHQRENLRTIYSAR